MKQVLLGNASFTVSQIVLGTWQVSGWATSDTSKFQEIITTAKELGINTIDTAPAYGEGLAEELVGKQTHKNRDSWIIATKLSPGECAPDRLRQSLEKSLRRLKTDYIDLYQQHWPPKSPALDETIAELLKLKDEGKIRAIGVSNWEQREWQEVSEESVQNIASHQPCYSLLWRRSEQFEIPFCQKNKIGLLAYSPLCQGLLTGKYLSREAIPEDPRKNNVLTRRELFSQTLCFINFLEQLALKYEVPLAQIAIAWVVQQTGVSAAIVGASKKEHISTASKASNLIISEKDLLLLNQESEKFLEPTKPFKSLWNWRPKRKKR